jgi:hypothetical protein
MVDVLIYSRWWNSAIELMLTSSEVRPATTRELIRVRGPLVDRTFKASGSVRFHQASFAPKDPFRSVKTRLLIPWGQILAIRIIDEPGMRLGFTVEETGKAR